MIHQSPNHKRLVLATSIIARAYGYPVVHQRDKITRLLLKRGAVDAILDSDKFYGLEFQGTALGQQLGVTMKEDEVLLSLTSTRLFEAR